MKLRYAQFSQENLRIRFFFPKGIIDMNSTFKVVFNKARGALMVVNEVTSSVQAKGTKTVVAAAVATMIAGVAGTAMAEEVAESAAKSTITVNDANRSGIEKEDVFDGYTSGSDQYKSGAIYITDGKTTTFKDGVKFTNNTSEMSGGAIEVQAGTVNLKDAVITGNKADTWGGAIRIAGNSTVNLTVTKDAEYSGNKANANGKLSYADAGDFVYMNGSKEGQTALNLEAQNNATMTIADSIAGSGSNNVITTKGNINVTGSMEAYTGDISVETGTFKLAGGFGSYDLWTTSNGAKKNSNAVAKLTVKKKAAAELGALTITRTSQDSDNKSIAGTELVVEQGGKLTVESITVTSQQYVNKDKKLDWTSHGWGKLENKGSEATVKDHITVEAGGKFEMTGDVTVGRINTAAAVDLEGADKDLAAGVITHTGGTLTLNNGKSVNNGKVALDQVVLDKGAVLETSVISTKFSANALTLNKGTTLNITELNSNFDQGLGTKPEGETKVLNQWLLTNKVVLNGGTLSYQNGTLDNIMIGRRVADGEPVATSELVVGADYGFKNLTLGNAGTVTVEDAGSLDIGTLHMKNTGGKIENSGKVTIGAADIFDKVTTDQFVNTGDVYTSVGLLVKTEGQTTALTNFGKLFENDKGIVYDTTLTGNYTLADIKKLQDLHLTNFGYLNGNLVAEKGSNVTWAEFTGSGVTNLNADNAVIEAKPAQNAKNSEINLSGDKSVTVGGFDVGTAKTVAVTTEGDAELEIVGVSEGADLFAGSALESITFVGKNITLGDNESNAVINAKVLLGQAPAAAKAALFASEQINTAVEIKGTQKFNEGLVFNTTDAQLTIAKDASLKVTGGIDFAFEGSNPNSILVNGDLEADWVVDKKGVVVVNTDGAFAQLGNKPAKAEKAGEAETNAYAGALVTPMSTFGQDAKNALMSFGADLATAKAAMAEVAGEKNERNFVYVAKQLDNSGAAFTVTNTDFIVDLAGVAATEGFKAEEGVVHGTLEVAQGESTMVHLKNLTGAAMTGKAGQKSLKLASKAFEGEGKANVNVDYGTVFYGNKNLSAENPTVGQANADGTISFAKNANTTHVYEDTFLSGAINSALDNVTFGQNAMADSIIFGTDDFVAALKETEAYKNLKDEEKEQFLVSAVSNAIDSVDTASVMTLAGGAFNVALDVNNEVTGAITRHTSLVHQGNAPRAQGMNAWADVFATKNEAKSIYGDAGYEADIYGAVLGFDYTASCGGVLGLAMNIGTADANGVGSDIDNDADFYGISLYAAQQFGKFNVQADLGYNVVKNDLTAKTAFGNFSEDADADVFTFGLGTEFYAQAGSVNVVPHAGIRMTRIDMDDSRFGVDYDTMTLWQMPIGVAFSGTFETTGWKLAPMVDLSVVPAFGDKDAEFAVGTVADNCRVVDSNPIQGTLGIAAQKDAWTFGLNYRMTAGSDDRMNNSFNASARYTF